ncbi:plasmid mobilization relaxosome protein MobC [Danxiaibacter flavus]|uniref:Plasmid mobilization relaxosome protein MobC n=1 Tax=Danxiaibacter flavus TaxID=3049108 RepID=A0ABV3ZKK5_9BACT|nr:plasmid mobilization relaxosome protein MobC [Chitinophagaceae bacterium DXS]
MTKAQNKKNRWLHIRLSEPEYQKINGYYQQTTCRKLSQYARNVLLQKAVVFKHRNQSLDDFMTALIELRKELNAIGNNLNQTVKKLHTLQAIDEFKSWLETAQLQRQKVVEKTEQIQLKINQISAQWLQ